MTGHAFGPDGRLAETILFRKAPDLHCHPAAGPLHEAYRDGR